MKIKISMSPEFAAKCDRLLRILCVVVMAYEASRFIMLSGEPERLWPFEIAYSLLIVLLWWFYTSFAMLLTAISIINYFIIQPLDNIALKHMLMRADALVCGILLLIVLVLNYHGIVDKWLVKRE